MLSNDSQYGSLKIALSNLPQCPQLVSSHQRLPFCSLLVVKVLSSFNVCFLSGTASFFFSHPTPSPEKGVVIYLFRKLY
jgi:hypothetical protein